jgi:hypothetical protein
VAASAALDGADKIAGVPARIVGGAFLRHPHPVFDFGEGLLGQIEVGRARRPVPKPGASGLGPKHKYQHAPPPGIGVLADSAEPVVR